VAFNEAIMIVVGRLLVKINQDLNNRFEQAPVFPIFA
jgi:hypothetical protein